MWERIKAVRPFWWFVAFFAAINLLWIAPSFLGARALSRGTSAPDFALPLVPSAGGRLSLGELRGRAVVMVFWATWCDACLAEIPVVEEISRLHPAEGLVVVGMNLEPEDRPGVARFLESHPLGFENVSVDEATAAAYGVRVLPTIYVVDAAGRICRGFTGRTSGFRLKRAVEACIRDGAGRS
jgi:thiol-disulfide isomerase/thioredoxin